MSLWSRLTGHDDETEARERRVQTQRQQNAAVRREAEEVLDEAHQELEQLKTKLAPPPPSWEEMLMGAKNGQGRRR